MNLQSEFEYRCREHSDIVDHLPFLFNTVCRFPGAEVIELGVRGGNSTAALLAAADAVDGHLWSVDVQPPQVPGWWQPTGRWTLLVGDDLNPAVLADLPDDVDVLFIDTSHTYEQTTAELFAYVPRVRSGGVVLLHDTELERPEAGGENFPVARAVTDFCDAHGWSWTNRPGCYGLGVVEVP